MEAFVKFVSAVNNVIWSTPLVILCFVVAIYFSLRMKLPQIRLFKDMMHLIVAKPEGDTGITPFQAFATTVGSRVGVGNVAGVATAIYFGGPGTVFWMMLISILGSCSALVETTLAQAYKRKNGSEYVGGPAHYIERGMKLKPLAIAFALSTILANGMLMPGLQVYSIGSTIQAAFGVPPILSGIVCTVLIGIVVCGGIKRIGKVAELLAPLMCLIYFGMTLGIIVLHYDKIPAVINLVFKNAFGMDAMYGGILGATIAWGVKRAVYSSEAGLGTGAIVSAAAECSHPAKQGLVQAGSILIGTLNVCTATALILLLTDSYNVMGAKGQLLTQNLPGVEYGILWAQAGVTTTFSHWAGKILSCIIVLFVFTSLMGFYYQAESNVRYLAEENKSSIIAFRGVFLVAVFSGVIFDGEIVWSMGDLGIGFMAWINLVAILFLSKKAIAILQDYEEQKGRGLDPVFVPEKFGIEDLGNAWAEYRNKHRSSSLEREFF